MFNYKNYEVSLFNGGRMLIKKVSSEQEALRVYREIISKLKFLNRALQASIRIYSKWKPATNSAHSTAEAMATWAMDKTAPTLRYSLRLMLTPLRLIVSSQITIASEPSGKKCGPKLFPIMLLKIKPCQGGSRCADVLDAEQPENRHGPVVHEACSDGYNHAWRKNPQNRGQLACCQKRRRKQVCDARGFQSLNNQENAEHKEHDVPVDVLCQPDEPFLLAVH